MQEVYVDSVDLVASDTLLPLNQEALEGAPHVVTVGQVDAESPLVNFAENLQELLCCGDDWCQLLGR